MTNTPLATKIEVLSNINIDYHSEDYEWSSSADELADFYNEDNNQEVFSLATYIKIGYAMPTDSGIQLINDYFDEVCKILGKTEDIVYSVKDIY